jgi:hypothetical protein
MAGENVRRGLLRVALSCTANEGSATEVSRRESPARAGLQVAFEAHCLLLGREPDDNYQGPRAVLGGMSAGTVVVPPQPVADVACHADVVTVRMDAAPKDVDEALADAEHAVTTANLGPIFSGTIPPVNVGLRRTLSSRLRRFCNAPAGAMLRKLPRLGFARVDERSRGGFESLHGVRLRPAFAASRATARLRRDSLRVSAGSRALGDLGADADLLA